MAAESIAQRINAATTDGQERRELTALFNALLAAIQAAGGAPAKPAIDAIIRK